MRTTGQDFLHSWRQRLGLHLSLATMAIRVSFSSGFDIARAALLRWNQSRQTNAYKGSQIGEQNLSNGDAKKSIGRVEKNRGEPLPVTMRRGRRSARPTVIDPVLGLWWSVMTWAVPSAR